MTIVYVADGVDIGNEAVRLGKTTSGFITHADAGTVGTGGLPIDDPTGSLNLVGWRPFYVNETACVGHERLFTGYMVGRDITRGAGTGSPSLLTAGARVWDTSLIDLNAIFQLLSFETAADNRPAETITARIAWLMASAPMALVTGTQALISSSGATISANDYRGQYPVDVCNDIAAITGWNYFLYAVQPNGTPALFLGPPGDPTYLSTLSISNVLSDLSSTCLYPLVDAKLVRDPTTHTYSGVRINFTGGSTYQQNTLTAETFIPRDVVITSSHIGRLSTAIAEANQYLANASNKEYDTIQCTLKVPAAQVNLIEAGMRIQVKFSHLPGYSSPTNMRVSLRDVKMDEETDEFYNMSLELVNPVATRFGNFGTGFRPDIGPITNVPLNTPACLTSIGSIAVVSSADGHYPVPICGGYDNIVGSRLFCHDESVGNPCGLGQALYWGSIISGREQKTLGYSVPVGAVTVQVTAHVTSDGNLSNPPTSGGLYGAHGWQVCVNPNPPDGWYDGQTFIASTVSVGDGSGGSGEITAQLPANLFDGSTVYFVTAPSWKEPERFVCAGVGAPFPGGDYLSLGAIDSLTFMGFCDGTIGLANWVGGVGPVNGSNANFALVQWDGTGQPQAKVNGLPTPVTANPDGTITFTPPPPAGSLVTFQYNVNQTVAVPPAPNPGSIQALLDADMTGTVTLTPGTYSAQTVQIRKTNQTLDMNGSVLDSTGQTIGIQLTANGTTVKNGTVENCGNPLQTGAIQVSANGCTVDTMITHLNNGAGIAAFASGYPSIHLNDVTITNCTMDHNVQEGFALYYVDTYSFTGNTIHDNNPDLLVNPGWEAGGGKFLKCTGGTVSGNLSHHNGGPGLWWDNCPVASTVVSGNTTHHNQVGLMVEASGGFTVHGNAVYEEGWTNGEQGWGWPAGMLFSTTINCEAYSNTLGWNDVGITVLWQPFRVGGDAPASAPTGNSMHNNTVVATDVSGSGGLRMEGWYEDGGGTGMFTDHTNKGFDEQFYSTLPGPSSDRYEYNGPLSSINAYQVTVGGNGAVEIGSVAALAALTAAGIPTTPDHT